MECEIIMDKNMKLSGRELDIMNVFWEAGRPLIAKEIVENDSSLTINTVQPVLKKLIKKNYIKIAEIVYSGTVLTRSYIPLISADKYMAKEITDGICKNRMSIEGIMATLVEEENNDPEMINKLENLLSQYRQDLNKRS